MVYNDKQLIFEIILDTLKKIIKERNSYFKYKEIHKSFTYKSILMITYNFNENSKYQIKHNINILTFKVIGITRAIYIWKKFAIL